MEQLDDDDPIPFQAHRIFFRATDPSAVYILDDGSIIVSDGSCATVFDEESYSIWLYESGALDRAIRQSPKSKVEIRNQGVVIAHVISDFLADVILSFGSNDSNNADSSNDVYTTPNGWTIIRDLVSCENYLIKT